MSAIDLGIAKRGVFGIHSHGLRGHLDLLICGGQSKLQIQTNVLSRRQVHFVDYSNGETLFRARQTVVSRLEIFEEEISRAVTERGGVGILIHIV